MSFLEHERENRRDRAGDREAGEDGGIAHGSGNHPEAAGDRLRNRQRRQATGNGMLPQQVRREVERRAPDPERWNDVANRTHHWFDHLRQAVVEASHRMVPSEASKDHDIAEHDPGDDEPDRNRQNRANEIKCHSG